MENIADKFKNYLAGDVLKICWDRGNGELNANFNYYGINPFDNSPLLIDVKNTDVKTLKLNQHPATSYSRMHGVEPVVFFDAINGEIDIKRIERVFWLPSYKTDGVYGIEGVNWTRDEDGSIIEF